MFKNRHFVDGKRVMDEDKFKIALSSKMKALQMAIKLYNYYNLLKFWNSCKRFTLAVNLRYNIGF